MSQDQPHLALPLVRPLHHHPLTNQRMTAIRQRHLSGKPTPNVLQCVAYLKYGVGLNHLPSGRFGANAAWLALNVMAHNLSRWTVKIGGIDTVEIPVGGAGAGADQPPAEAPERTPKSFVATDTLRRRHLAIPGRLATSARRLTLHLPARWPWAEGFTAMLEAIRAVPLVI